MAQVTETPATTRRPSSQRLSSTLRHLVYLSGLGEERELIDAVVQAAAIWYDVDARAYRRDLHGRFVLDTWLPGADLSVAPHDFSSFAIVSGPEIIRISSLAEQEQLGWQGLHGDVVLLPIPAGAKIQPRWVIAISDWRDQKVDPCLLVLCQMLGTFLEQLAVNRVRDVQQRLLRWLVQNDEPFERLAGAVLEELVEVVGATQARLVVRTAAGVTQRTVASVGGEWAESALPALEAGQSVITPERIAVALAMGPSSSAVVDLRRSAGSEFSDIDGRLGEAGAMVIGVWLAGTLKGRADAGSEAGAAAAAGFEKRIAEEVNLARRFHLEAGLLVIDLVRAEERIGARPLDPVSIPDVVSTQFRTSDLLGRLEDGQIGVLLVHTDAEGVAAAAARIRRQLDDVARHAGLPAVTLGQATFPASGQSVAALVEQARADAARRSHEIQAQGTETTYRTQN